MPHFSPREVEPQLPQAVLRFFACRSAEDGHVKNVPHEDRILFTALGFTLPGPSAVSDIAQLQNAPAGVSRTRLWLALRTGARMSNEAVPLDRIVSADEPSPLRSFTAAGRLRFLSKPQPSRHRLQRPRCGFWSLRAGRRRSGRSACAAGRPSPIHSPRAVTTSRRSTRFTSS